jgi:Fanconi anemia group M protein
LSIGKEHPKLYKLKEIVEEELSKNSKSKIIIFAQFRETINKIKNFLDEVNGAKVGIFVGQAMKENTRGVKTGLKQKEQKEMVEKFKNGEVNILVATSIAEEGLDIPEVSLVVFYEPVPSAIRKIQRSGRTARLSPGELKVLITKGTRDEIYYYSSYNKEKRMHKVIDEIQKNGLSKDSQLKLQ